MFAQIDLARSVTLDEDDASVEVVLVSCTRELRYLRNATCNGKDESHESKVGSKETPIGTYR